jgi:preprotein translocase subunit SecG
LISLLLAAAKAAPIKVPLSKVPTPGPLQVNPGLNYSPQNLTWFQQHAGWLTHTLGAVFMIAALALIVLLAVQTTKQEGLSGTLGGRVESVYGRPGAEEQLKRVTGVVAVAFVVVGTILSLTGI